MLIYLVLFMSYLFPTTRKPLRRHPGRLRWNRITIMGQSASLPTASKVLQLFDDCCIYLHCIVAARKVKERPIIVTLLRNQFACSLFTRRRNKGKT